MCFVLLCKALDIPLLLSLFRCLYVPMVTKDWVFFSLLRGGIDICYGLPTSIKKLKEEFFFIDASAIATRMHFGDLANRHPDPAPELTVTEHDVNKRLIINYLVWSGPNELSLGFIDLDSTYGDHVVVSVPN